LVSGIYAFVQRSREVRALEHPSEVGHHPLPHSIGAGLFLLWVLSFNLLVAGTVTGIIAALRAPGRGLRAVAFAGAVLGGVTVVIWAMHRLGTDRPFDSHGFVGDGRLAALVVALAAAAVAAATTVLMHLLPAGLRR
jgi:hypothetical protein